jgi:hypothetical protein
MSAWPTHGCSQGATAEVVRAARRPAVLRVRLPYLSVTDYVALAAAQAPHAPGAIHLSSASTALELEA